jgi:xanthine dehydrogenase YagR molybdenum-binding subunit
LIECLQTGAQHFGWADRDPKPGNRIDGEWLIGSGVASAVYPAMVMPGNTARIEHVAPGRFLVQIAAVDIGTGTWTTLAQIAADALDVDLNAVDRRSVTPRCRPPRCRRIVGHHSCGWPSSPGAGFPRRQWSTRGSGCTVGVRPRFQLRGENYGMYSFVAHFAEAR